MRRMMLFVAFVVLVLVAACAPTQPAPAPIDRAFARASVVHMGFSVQAAARRCSAQAQWLEGFSDQQGNAERLYNLCVQRLIPARDALLFAVEEIDPWTVRSQDVVGCTGKTVRVALEALRADFRTWQVDEPAIMSDGIQVGGWAEQYARPECDPLHAPTRVKVFEDPSIPPVEPNYPQSVTVL